jgi:hypothetical protein
VATPIAGMISMEHVPTVKPQAIVHGKTSALCDFAGARSCVIRVEHPCQN